MPTQEGYTNSSASFSRYTPVSNFLKDRNTQDKHKYPKAKKNEEEDFRYRSGPCGDPGETEYTRYYSYDQKKK